MPPIYEVTATKAADVNLIISASDAGKVKAYAIVKGIVYKTGATSFSNGTYRVRFQGLETLVQNGFSGGTYIIKYSDHFLCENIGG